MTSAATGLNASRRRRTRHPAEQLRLLAARRLDQPVGGVLDHGGDARDEFAARQAGRQRIEKFDHQRARIAHEGPARPEQPRIERDRQTGHAAIDIDLRDAGLVMRRRIDRGSRAFRENDQLTAAPHFLAGAARHLQQRAAAGAAIDPDHVRLDQIPAEQRNPFQLALEDEQRLIEELQQREGFPHRLMFRRDDQRPLRNFLEPAIFHLDVADHAHQPDAAARPISGDVHDGPARHQVGRNPDDHPERQQQIEQHVVDQRTQENRNHRKPDQLA